MREEQRRVLFSSELSTQAPEKSDLSKTVDQTPGTSLQSRCKLSVDCLISGDSSELVLDDVEADCDHSVEWYDRIDCRE